MRDVFDRYPEFYPILFIQAAIERKRRSARRRER